MHVILLAPPEDASAEALTERIVAAGGRITRAAPDAHLERETRDATAIVDFHRHDLERKARELTRHERWLPRGLPVLGCCHCCSATELAAWARKDPSRVSGFALLAPWQERRTVECALPMQASAEAQAAAERFWRSIGLEPVWVGDAPGLVLPRIVAGLANEACFALGEGLASAEDIDRAMMLGTRYPRGPLAWAETIGLTELLAILDGLAAHYREERYRAAPLLRSLVAAGRESLYDSLSENER